MRVLLALGFFAVGCAVLLVGFVVAVNVMSNDEPLDCSTVRLPEPSEWRLLDLGDKGIRASDLSACDRLDGLSAAELTAAFGPPDGQDATPDGTTVLIYVFDPEDDPGDSDEMRLFLDADQVVDVEVVSSSGP